jgi:hypothetical protein
MTVEEFNIKYKDYLEEGHYGLDINDNFIINYLDNQFQQLIKINGFKYTQIKLKFNSCRFYTNLNEVLKGVDHKIDSGIERYITNYFELSEIIKKNLD